MCSIFAFFSQGSFVWAHFVMAASLLMTIVFALTIILYSNYENTVSSHQEILLHPS